MRQIFLTTIGILLFFVVGVQAQKHHTIYSLASGAERHIDFYSPQYEQGRHLKPKEGIVACRGYMDTVENEKHGRFITIRFDYAYVNKDGTITSFSRYLGGLKSYLSEGLVPDERQKWGFIDKTGKEVIPYQYENAGSFSGGLAPVKLNGKWGFINKANDEVIPFKYDEAAFFSEGFACVKLNGKWGFVDKTGNVVIQHKYDDAGNFSGGIVPVKLNGKWGLIDKTGNIVVSCKYDDAIPFSEGITRVVLNKKWGLIDKTGQEIVTCKYDRIHDLSEGLAGVELGNQLGFMTKTGKIAIPFFFNKTEKPRSDIRINFVRGGDGTNSAIMYDALMYGDKTLLTQWEWLDYLDSFPNGFSSGIAMVGMDGGIAFIDKLGRVILQTREEENNTISISPFIEGMAQATYVNKNGGISGIYIDLNGENMCDICHHLMNRGAVLKVVKERAKEGKYNRVLKQIAEAEEEFNRKYLND